jgi:membrane-bound inhibitor of C-type lysozyme
MRANPSFLRPIVPALLLIALAGPAIADPSANYRCDDGSFLTATFAPPDAAKGSAELVFADGRKAKLPQVLSADGGRYAAGDAEFWIKGNEATLTLKGKSTRCATIE